MQPSLIASGSFKIAVYGFDGSPTLYPLLLHQGRRRRAQRRRAAVVVYKARPSTNLNGRWSKDSRFCRRRWPTSRRRSSLARWSCLHRRPTGRSAWCGPILDKALDGAREDRTSLYVIGIGKEINTSELRNIGRTHAFLSQDPTELAKAFDDVAQRVEGYTKSFYLCPTVPGARAGARPQSGHASRHGLGSLTYHFNAQGFGPNCDSNRMPHFDLKNPTKHKAGEGE